MKKSISILFALVVLLSSSIEKSFTVTGIVTTADDGAPLPGVNVALKNSSVSTITDSKGKYSITAQSETGVLIFSFIGYTTEEVDVKGKNTINVKLHPDVRQLQEVVNIGYGKGKKENRRVSASAPVQYEMQIAYDRVAAEPAQNFNTEEYAAVNENIFHEALKKPLSTFSIDVDAASYSNVRRMLNYGQLPHKDMVRIEEMVNYFNYDYPQPTGKDPFSITTEVSECPWNSEHQLIHVGLQGKKIPVDNLPASNLVFLIDVSGSMDSPEKLPLLKSSFNLLIDQLRTEDKIAIVVYAGAAGLVLPSTAGNKKEAIKEAFNNLQAGGSTAGGAGINLAYKVAKDNFIKGGNNRIILATDGDFNIGASSNAEMERLVEEKRKEGVFLTVLGFGMGNYKDSKMEILADKGNGNYAYIDNISEARKVLVNEFGGTLFTIAKDVKIQVEFNPAQVQSYRLVGYENRKLNDEDFNNDKKDAGELGSGHTVTALYEIVPTGTIEEMTGSSIDPLKYQKHSVNPKASQSKEIMTVKFRYKEPDGETSKLIEIPLLDKKTSLAKASDNFRFSAAVAGFGMLLRDSEYKGTSTYEQVESLAKAALGKDEEGYRSDFLKMVKAAKDLSPKVISHREK